MGLEDRVRDVATFVYRGLRMFSSAAEVPDSPLLPP